MNIIETTLNVKSNPDWKTTRALCEILANAIDAMKEVFSNDDGAGIESKSIEDIRIKYIKNTVPTKNRESSNSLQGVSFYELSIKDYGSGITESHLTSQGKSSKRGVCHTIGFNGYHGKGLLESCAVLKREGFDIRIISQHLNVKVILNDMDNIAFKNMDNMTSEDKDEGFLSRWFSKESEGNTNEVEGTQVIISHSDDFSNIVNEMESEFIYFKNSKGDLLESTKFGNIYLPPRGEKGKIFVYGFAISVDNGICKDTYFSYDFYDCPEIDKALRNTDSGNNRRLTSRKISIQLHKIHEAVSSPDIIKIARKLIKSNEYEFKDKIIVKRYSEKKIKKISNDPESLSSESRTVTTLSVSNVPTLAVKYKKRELSIDDKEDSLGDDRNDYKKCIIKVNTLDNATIDKLKMFLTKNNIKHKFS